VKLPDIKQNGPTKYQAKKGRATAEVGVTDWHKNTIEVKVTLGYAYAERCSDGAFRRNLSIALKGY